jgi:hypothetical protein
MAVKKLGLWLLLTCVLVSLVPASAGATPITISFNIEIHSPLFGEGYGHATVNVDPDRQGQNGSLVDFYLTYAGLVWTRNTGPAFSQPPHVEYEKGHGFEYLRLESTADELRGGTNNFEFLFDPVTPLLTPRFLGLACRDCGVNTVGGGVFVTQTSPVPEPSSALLVITGVGMLGRTTWRKLRTRSATASA